MALRRAFAAFYLAISLACLAGGFGAAGSWPVAGLVLLPGLALWSGGRLGARRPGLGWLPFAGLACLVLLAAAGLLAGAPAFLMIPGATAALGAWDLTNLDRALAGTARSAAVRRFERGHVRLLGLVLGVGLLLAAGGRLLTLRIPFVPLLLLVGLDLLVLDRAYRALTDREAL